MQSLHISRKRKSGYLSLISVQWLLQLRWLLSTPSHQRTAKPISRFFLQHESTQYFSSLSSFPQTLKIFSSICSINIWSKKCLIYLGPSKSPVTKCPFISGFFFFFDCCLLQNQTYSWYLKSNSLTEEYRVSCRCNPESLSTGTHFKL